MLRRTLLLLASIAIAALLLGAVLAWDVRRARTRDYARDPHYHVDTTIPGAGTAIELGVAGDSTVAGLGTSRVEDSLPVQVARELNRLTKRPVHVVAVGVSGATTRDVAVQQLRRLPSRLDVLVIEVGSNDVTHGTGLGALQRQTRDLLRRARDRAPVVVLGGAGRLDTRNFPQPLRQLLMWRAGQVRGRQRRALHGSGAGYVDIAGVVGDRFARTPHATSADGFHPGPAGYRVWAKSFAAEVADRLH